jgi:hypothetical protein
VPPLSSLTKALYPVGLVNVLRYGTIYRICLIYLEMFSLNHNNQQCKSLGEIERIGYETEQKGEMSLKGKENPKVCKKKARMA